MYYLVLTRNVDESTKFYVKALQKVTPMRVSRYSGRIGSAVRLACIYGKSNALTLSKRLVCKYVHNSGAWSGFGC